MLMRYTYLSNGTKVSPLGVGGRFAHFEWIFPGHMGI